jgi:putative membrane protein
MLNSVVIGALSGTLMFATAAVAADQAAKPTDPQIAHIAYTAGQLDIEAAKQALALAPSLQDALRGAFPFAGKDCEALTQRVLARLAR